MYQESIEFSERVNESMTSCFEHDTIIYKDYSQ